MLIRIIGAMPVISGSSRNRYSALIDPKVRVAKGYWHDKDVNSLFL